MKLDNMFKKTKYSTLRRSEYKTEITRPEVPEGLLRKCNKCGAAIIAEDVKKDAYICPKCGGYFRMHAYRRIEFVADEGTFEEWDRGLETKNPLEYKGYTEKLQGLKEKTGLDEAVITGKAKIDGTETVIGVCDGRFLMASMGEVVGEKIARAVERATKERLPVILFACSGGARMQEGITSLMQMAKTSAALKRHSDAGLLYISVLTDPTTGGVTASFAMLGDIILAEPKALIGFAGPRVIEQTIGQKLPKGFQRSEFLLEHGFLDGIVERSELKETLANLLKLHEDSGCGSERIQALLRGDNCADTADGGDAGTGGGMAAYDADRPQEAGSRSTESVRLNRSTEHLSSWDRVMLSRMQDRPVTVIAQAKGTNTKENIERNFGMPSPEGYRKALRLMKQAEKFHRPVICFVDTPGAFCGLEAEERGQGEAIARNIYEMSSLKVPVLSVIIGEGGSGGALAMATADEVWMLENSVYSILSPEGFASILWKDSSKAKEAAEVMKLTANDLCRLGIVEKVFEEPQDFSAENFDQVICPLKEEITRFLAEYGRMSGQELAEYRYMRFRNM